MIKQGDVIVDGTVGAGGHSAHICKQFGSGVTLICLDQDVDALARAKKKIAASGCEPIMIESNFRTIKDAIEKAGYHNVNKILLDLGLSSDQLENSERGFTFQKNEPLKMTMKKNPTADDVTAYDIVNTWSETSLSDIIYGYGEETYSRKIAKKIVEARKSKKIETTFDLVEIIKSAVPGTYAKRKIHPATKTFQALRIAVNDELEALKTVLKDSTDILSPGGRIAIISFHSLEDRIVKRFFKEKNDSFNIITKRPIVATKEEASGNPRARSAKLRIAEKI